MNMVLKITLISGAMLWCKFTCAQVYNYTPVNYFDIETNPSKLASEQDINNRVQLIHLNNFSSSRRFSFSSLRMSKYFESSFTGLGLALSNTGLKDDISYSHVAICGGYRNVLFNAVLLRIGAAYKITSAKHPQERYDYYSFSPPEAGQQPEGVKHNMNVSFSLSKGADWLYASFSFLNLDLPWNSADNSMRFPKYFCANFGNFINLLIDETSWQVSYSLFRKFFDATENFLPNHYMNLGYKVPVTRSSGLEFDFRAGYLENEFLHFIPGLKYYRVNFAFALSYGFHGDKIKFNPAYYSTTQINVIYLL